MAALGWARLVCGFVGSWVALGFVWVSFYYLCWSSLGLCTIAARSDNRTEDNLLAFGPIWFQLDLSLRVSLPLSLPPLS